MSRVAGKKIDITDLKECKLSSDGKSIFCQGQVHSFTITVPSFLDVVVEANQYIKITFNEDITFFKNKRLKRLNYPMWGTFVRTLEQKIKGIVSLHQRNLKVSGTGYKVEKKDDKLILKVGLTHLLEVEIPSNIEIELKTSSTSTEIIMKSIDKCSIGDFSHKLCLLRPPKGYDDKGIYDTSKKLLIKEVNKK